MMGIYRCLMPAIICPRVRLPAPRDFALGIDNFGDLPAIMVPTPLAAERTAAPPSFAEDTALFIATCIFRPPTRAYCEYYDDWHRCTQYVLGHEY